MSDSEDPNDDAAPQANGSKLNLVRTGTRSRGVRETTTEELSPTELTAFKCFTGLGFAPSADSLKQSILARIKEKGHLAGFDYTPDYFVEEIIFAIALSVEAEQRYGFVSHLIEEARGESEDGPTPTLPEVIACMSAMAQGIARGRMIFAQVPDQVTNDKFWERFETGMGNYCELLKTSLGRTSLLPGNPIMARPSPDDEGHYAYLGTVGENLAESLSIPAEDRDNRVLLKSFLVTVWNAVMSEVAETTKS